MKTRSTRKACSTTPTSYVPLTLPRCSRTNAQIDALLKKNITPVITIFHWDHPQALEERYGGFFNEKEIVADFVRYSDVLFERLGDRCKHWVTFNEVRPAQGN